jgi:hypothetical protein
MPPGEESLERRTAAEHPPSFIIVPGVAPGWDKHALAERYKAWVAGKGEMPRYPDAAFLGS